MNRPLFIVFAMSLVVSSGCGSGLPQTIPVSGRVTFDGQPPPAAGIVYFLPIEPAKGFPSRPGDAAFAPDGQFKAKTFEPGDGLMPGKYLMTIECWASPPNMEGNPVKSHVPKKYQSPQASGFALDIAPDMDAQEITLNVVTK
jgi:hypothetical protein